jgi:phage baseplate assembly protein W
MTANYERPFHSEIGSPIKKLLFEPVTPMLEVMLRRAIMDTIDNFEPRVQVLDVIVVVSEDEYEVSVTIEFQIVNTNQPLTLDLVLERTR